MENLELVEEDPVQATGVEMNLSLHQGFGKFCSERRMLLHVGGWPHAPTMPAGKSVMYKNLSKVYHSGILIDIQKNHSARV